MPPPNSRPRETGAIPLVSAVATTSVSDGIMMATAPLLAASMSSDPRAIAGATAAATLPYLLLALPTGVFVDHTTPRLTLLGPAVVRMVVAVVLAALAVMNGLTLAMLYVLVFLAEASRAMFDTTVKTLIPRLVTDSALEATNSRVMMGQFLGDGIAGRALGGLLFTFGPSLPLMLYATAQAAAGWFSLLATRGADLVTPSQHRLDGLTHGVRWLRHHRALGGVALMHAARSLAGGAVAGILVVFALDQVGMPAGWYGLLLMCLPIGGLAAILRGRLLVTTVPPQHMVPGCIALEAVLYVALGATSAIAVVAFVLAGIAFSGVIWNLSTLTLRQRVVPVELQGRVQSVYLAFQFGLTPVGAVLGGLLGAATDARVVILLAGGWLMLVSSLALALRSSLAVLTATLSRPPAPKSR